MPNHLLCLFITLLFRANADIRIGNKKVYLIPEIIEVNENPNLNQFLGENVDNNANNSFNINSEAINFNEVSVKLSNYYNIIYTCKLKIGKRKDKFKMLLDTGSDWTWVNSDQCVNCKNKRFSCNTDNSCEKIPDSQISIRYAKGAVKGNEAIYPVYFQDQELGINIRGLVVEQQQEESSGFDGLVGLAPPTQTNNKTHWILQVMKDNNLIENLSFSVYLSDQSTGVETEFIFGGYDTKYMIENFTYHDLVTVNAWGIRLDDIKLDNSITLGNRGRIVIIDSGTSYLILSKVDFQQLIFNLKSKYGITCNEAGQDVKCEGKTDKFPTLYFLIGGQNYTLEPKMYTREKNLLIHGQDVGGGKITILGMYFMRKYYTYYNYENQTIGLSLAKQYDPIFPTWIKVVLIILGVSIIVLLSFYAYKKFKSSDTKNEENQNNQNLLE